jgi:hypothetical protein
MHACSSRRHCSPGGPVLPNVLPDQRDSLLALLGRWRAACLCWRCQPSRIEGGILRGVVAVHIVPIAVVQVGHEVLQDGHRALGLGGRPGSVEDQHHVRVSHDGATIVPHLLVFVTYACAGMAAGLTLALALSPTSAKGARHYLYLLEAGWREGAGT